MAKKQAAKMGDTIEVVRPYLERALRDEDFRRDLKDALLAARELYGPLSKSNGGVAGSAKLLATDKKAQEQLRRAVEDFSNAAGTLKGDKSHKKSHKARKTLLLVGVIAGALYNPWTGPQTRERLLDMLAGSDDLHPLDDLVPDDVTEAAVENGASAEPEKAETT